METENVQKQIFELNNKVDLLLEYMQEQRQKQQVVEDLVTDLSLIGKDAFQNTIEELDDQGVDIDAEQIKLLVFRLLKNVDNFTMALKTMESISDLMKDFGPIVNEMIIDFTFTLQKANDRGYLDFFTELAKLFDNIVTQVSKEDIKLLSENSGNILKVIKNITQPEILQSVNNALTTFQDLQAETTPEYSLFKVIREMRKPEMKRTLGFMMTFIKKMDNNNNQKELQKSE